MRHHAYFYAGDIEEGIAAALHYAKHTLTLEGVNNPDLLTLQYALFSVDDARFVCDLANRMPVQGENRLIIIAAGRIFHEAQNALLKTFEEPPVGTHLILIVPSEGNILPTLRSRMLMLPEDERSTRSSSLADEYVQGTSAKREKIVEKILERAKSDDGEEKQAARLEAIQFAEGLMRIYDTKPRSKETLALLSDLSRLIPILHERSAPLKPILEHLTLVTAKS